MLHTSHAFRLVANGNEARRGLHLITVTKKECRNCIGNEGTLKTGTKYKFSFFIHILYIAFKYGILGQKNKCLIF